MRGAIRLLLAVDVLVVILYLLNMATGQRLEFLTHLVELNAEENLPTWWSTVQLFTAGFLLAAFAVSRFRRADRKTWGVFLLPMPILVLSLDEAARIHEQLGHILDRLAPRAAEIGLAFNARAVWTLVLLPIALLGVWIAGLLSRQYFRGRPAVVRRFVLGFAVLFGAATILEVFFGAARSEALRVVERIAEEFGELVGGTILVWASAEFLASHGFLLVTGPDAGPAPEALERPAA